MIIGSTEIRNKRIYSILTLITPPPKLSWGFADNVILLGLASDVLAAQQDLEAQLCRDLSATPNLKESYFYAPAWTADGLTMGSIPKPSATCRRRAAKAQARWQRESRGPKVSKSLLSASDTCHSHIIHKE